MTTSKDQTGYTIFTGCIVDTPSVEDLRIRTDGIIGIDNATGHIIGVSDAVGTVGIPKLVSQWVGSDIDESFIKHIVLGDDQFLMPGLIDTHTHAPQFTFIGIGHDLPLMEWLEKYTFKFESSFSNLDTAQEFYDEVISRIVRNGVTCAAYYGTIHLEANKILADTIKRRGQRAYVGKVCMDANSPDYYSETTQNGLRDTEVFIKHVLDAEKDATYESRLVTPIITPRFAPSCTPEILSGLGKLAKRYNIPIQSHLCENPSEIQFAMSCFPGCSSYSNIYDKHGLFNDKTIMAHCVHMTEEEIALVKERGVGVSHCPNSNFTLSSGIADVRRFLIEKIPTGLGTDVGGGYTQSILDAMRMAASANRALISNRRDTGIKMTSIEAKPLEAGEAIYLATHGGAQVMNMDKFIGTLDAGKQFDALLVDLSVQNSPLFPLSHSPAIKAAKTKDEAWKLRIEQFVFLADDRNISRVYVNGKVIHSLD